MGSAFHQLCPRYSGTLTPTAPTANNVVSMHDNITFCIGMSTVYLLTNSLSIINVPSLFSVKKW